jgi:hypothetical protein
VPAGSPSVRWPFALALALAAGGAHADYRESYSRGLAALKDGNNAEARKLFEQALAEQPEPALRVRLYGQRWEAYLPQHYLGAAAFALGDCATALKQWNSGANQQITAQLSDIRSAQQRDAAVCEQKGAVAEKEAPAKPVATAPAPEPPAPERVASKPEPKPAASEPARPVASATPASVPPPAPPRVERAPPEKKSVDATRPPQPLVDAYDRYLAGRYAEVGRIDPDAYADARARFHAYLVRSAARFTLGEMSGDKDLLDGARADARAARALDAKRALDATLFSPRFRAFFREGS